MIFPDWQSTVLMFLNAHLSPRKQKKTFISNCYASSSISESDVTFLSDQIQYDSDVRRWCFRSFNIRGPIYLLNIQLTAFQPSIFGQFILKLTAPRMSIQNKEMHIGVVAFFVNSSWFPFIFPNLIKHHMVHLHRITNI